MGRKLLLCLLLRALRQLLQAPLEIGIPEGIALHAEPGRFLHQQLGLAGTHMEDAVAAVVTSATHTLLCCTPHNRANVDRILDEDVPSEEKEYEKKGR